MLFFITPGIIFFNTQRPSLIRPCTGVELFLIPHLLLLRRVPIFLSLLYIVIITNAFCLITLQLATQLLAFYVARDLNARPLLEYIIGIALDTIIQLEEDLELTGTFSPYAMTPPPVNTADNCWSIYRSMVDIITRHPD